MKHLPIAITLAAALSTAALFAAAPAALAVPITYTYTGTASGTVGATTLTNEAFAVIYTADTDNAGNYLGGPTQAFATGNVNVPANPLPTFTWGSVSGTFNNVPNTAYFLLSGQTALISGVFEAPLMFRITDPAVIGYDMVSPLSFAGTYDVNSSAPFDTTAGALTFSSTTTTGAFNAVGGIVAVPEAGTFALVGVGCLVLGIGCLRRKRAA